MPIVNTSCETRPVLARPVSAHGLFGQLHLRQHWMVDDRWTQNSLMEQFKYMTNVIARSRRFARMDQAAHWKAAANAQRSLRYACRDGRAKLQRVIAGDITKTLKNFFINHKELQRLYMNMSAYDVMDSINHGTFVMRKERDRLRYRMKTLKEQLKYLLIELGAIENRIKFEDEFILDEELTCNEFRKRIENSDIRVKGYKAINAAYKKIIQVLIHDSIFYEPILNSLNEDINDQRRFIDHLLCIGMPIIPEFRKLSIMYRGLEENARKQLQRKLADMNNLRRTSADKVQFSFNKTKPLNKNQVNDYHRETRSMKALHTELENVERTIKTIKKAALCSHAREIFPRIANMVNENVSLQKRINHENIGFTFLNKKKKIAGVLENIVINNLSDEDINRKNRIDELRDQLAEQDKITEKMLLHMKRNSEYYVILKKSMWNLLDIMKYVRLSANPIYPSYNTSYLKLPLLKFEMLQMKAYPPILFQEDTENLMRLLQHKMKKVVRAYTKYSTGSDPDLLKKYEEMYLSTTASYHEDTLKDEVKEVTDDITLEAKIMMNVPTHKQIKEQSFRILEEQSKKDE